VGQGRRAKEKQKKAKMQAKEGVKEQSKEGQERSRGRKYNMVLLKGPKQGRHAKRGAKNLRTKLGGRKKKLSGVWQESSESDQPRVEKKLSQRDVFGNTL